MIDISAHIRDIPDFPKPGILFRDITPLLADADAFHSAIDGLIAPFRGRVDLVLGIESRGFVLAAALAARRRKGFVPVRKQGKLPPPVVSAAYALEYGSGILEIQQGRGRLLLVDDVLATGGTAHATVDLVQQLGGDVHGVSFLIELLALNGRAQLPGQIVRAVLQY